jgi:hypothetical protein
MIELLKIRALVGTARALVFIGHAADFVSRATCRKGGALAIEATARMDARDAAWRRAQAGKLAGPEG